MHPFGCLPFLNPHPEKDGCVPRESLASFAGTEKIRHYIVTLYRLRSWAKAPLYRDVATNARSHSLLFSFADVDGSFHEVSTTSTEASTTSTEASTTSTVASTTFFSENAYIEASTFSSIEASAKFRTISWIFAMLLRKLWLLLWFNTAMEASVS